MEYTAYHLREANNPRQFIIDTVELRPLSLGHLMALETVRSPFLLPEPRPAPYEEQAIHYTTALFLCGHTWEDNELLLNDDDLWKKEFGEFTQHFMEKAVRANPEWNLDSRVKHFQHGYMKYFLHSMPILDPVGNQPLNENNLSGMDWKLNVKTMFSTKFRYDDSKIYNMSMTKLYFEWSSFCEVNGMAKVRSLAEQKSKEDAALKAAEFRQKMKELHAQKQEATPC